MGDSMKEIERSQPKSAEGPSSDPSIENQSGG